MLKRRFVTMTNRVQKLLRHSFMLGEMTGLFQSPQDDSMTMQSPAISTETEY
jgi:hypothetical protein